jgi:hypothetical protein
MASKLLGQTVIKLFGPNYLINGSVGYFFWPRGAVKKTLGAPRTEKVWEPLAYTVPAVHYSRECS